MHDDSSFIISVANILDKTADNISMGRSDMFNKRLIVSKSIHSLLFLLVVLTQPTEDLQVLLFTARIDI